MKTKLLCSALVLGLAIRAGWGQGTFIYHQQSFTSPIPQNILIPIQTGTGQSFIPDLPNVGFVQLQMRDAYGGNGLGVTVYVNLRSGAINGPILTATDPVFMPDGFFGVTNFFFAGPPAVSPNTSYFFEPVVQSGDAWYVNTSGGSAYPNGTMYVQGTLYQNAYFWFREGVLAPEPGGASLVLLWAGMACGLRRRRPRHES